MPGEFQYAPGSDDLLYEEATGISVETESGDLVGRILRILGHSAKRYAVSIQLAGTHKTIFLTPAQLQIRDSGHARRAVIAEDVISNIRKAFDSMLDSMKEFGQLEADELEEQDGTMTEPTKEYNRASVARAMGAPTAEQAIKAWRDDHEKSLDPKNCKDPEYTDYGGGAWGVRIPSYDE